MYNEAKRFDQLALLRFVEQNPNYSICLVNDGSKDSTWELIEEIRKNNTQVFALNLQLNSGKSEATRLGIIESLKHDSFDFVAFLDADFAAPLETIPFMFEQTSNKQFLLGSRILFLGARIERKPFRHYVGRIFATLASELLNLPIYDTQCGAKLFSRTWAEIAFRDPFITRWQFDLELIMRLINHFGWRQFKQNAQEIPLFQWIDKGDSKVKFTYMFRLPIDLIQIRRKYGKVNFNN